MIAVLAKNQDVTNNYQDFLKEVKELGLKEEQIPIVDIPENQNEDTQEQLFLNLIRAIPNHSEIRACITFGTKLISVIITLVLNFADKLLSDVEVFLSARNQYAETGREKASRKRIEKKYFNLSETGSRKR